MDASKEAPIRKTPSALVRMDGTVYGLNTAMATLLERPAEQCVGRSFARLFPEPQRKAADSLVAHGTTTQAVAMRVLEFPKNHGASVVCLIAAQPMNFPADREELVWVHSLEAGNDLEGLLIPFELAARSAGLSVYAYSPHDRELAWLGGESRLVAMFRKASIPLSWLFRHVHPSDRLALRRLLRSPATESQWISLRFPDMQGKWRNLVCQSRRIRLGYRGPQRVFGLIRDETREETRRQRVLADLSAQRHHATEIATFASALITAATEQELQQVVLSRVASSFGGIGALFALVDHERRLRVSSDAAVPPKLVEALHGLSLDASSPLPYAIRTGEQLFIHDREDFMRRWPQAGDLPSLPRDMELMIIPLGPNGAESTGACLMTRSKGRGQSGSERNLINLVAKLAGQALKRISADSARMELSITLQQAMLPRLPDHLPGLEVAARYQPSQDGLDIGGDWYDVFMASDGAVTVEIGDVQGHDVEAAAVMGQLRTSLRAIAGQESGPAITLTRINDLLVATATARFASCSMLRFDSGEEQVTGASAGHVPILLAHQNGSYDIHTLPGGPVLGVLRHALYTEEAFTLDWGTALVMVTDGLVEGPSVSLDAGLDRAGRLAAAALHDGLNAESIADRILEGEAQIGHLDDIAILVLRRR